MAKIAGSVNVGHDIYPILENICEREDRSPPRQVQHMIKRWDELNDEVKRLRVELARADSELQVLRRSAN